MKKLIKILFLTMVMRGDCFLWAGEDHQEYYKADQIFINFQEPTRAIQVKGVTPMNDPEPSAAGFFNGETIENYEKKLTEKYPAGFCIKKHYSMRGDFEDYYEDVTEDMKGFHYYWDIAAHRVITSAIGEVSAQQLSWVEKERNLSKSICCWGFNKILGSKEIKYTINDDTLTEEVKRCRAKKYIEIKQQDQKIIDQIKQDASLNLYDAKKDRSFSKAFHGFKTTLTEQFSDNQEEIKAYVDENLIQAYNTLKIKVKNNILFDQYKKEALWYQAGIAAQALLIGAAIYNRNALTKYAGYGLARIMGLKK